MDLPAVLRLPRSDNADDFVLLRISPKGRDPLYLNLVGTENTLAFSTSLTPKKRSEAKAKNFSGRQEQWEDTLSRVFLGKERTDFTEGVEAVAKVDLSKVEADSSISIIIQKRIEGITQRLGSILLQYTDDEIDLFEWCGLTLNSKHVQDEELNTLKTQLKYKDQETKRLADTLTELTKLKNEHEDGLIEKFAKILNEKKLKIRDQQRILASANVDPRRLAEVEQSRRQPRSSSPGPSRAAKRKAGATLSIKSDDESDDAYKKMDIDPPSPEKGPEEEEEERNTEDERSTASETEDDEPPFQLLTTSKGNDGQSSGSRLGQEPMSSEFPPKRDLPFAKSLTASKPPAEDFPPKRNLPDAKKAGTTPTESLVEALDGSETESDDEL